MDFAGKTAFVPGAANGIGLGICRALARSGVNLVLADIERAQLDIAREELSSFNSGPAPSSSTFRRGGVRPSDQAEAEFGNIRFLFNNAGVTLGPTPLWEMTPEQWEWIFGVNIFGVINGIRTLVPRMKGHGEAGQVVNAASIGGLQVNPNLRNGCYAMTKYAVVAASEALALDLQGSHLGVSLLCRALVATTLHASSQRRPPRLGGPYQRSGSESAKALQSAGLSPDEAGKRVLDAVARSEFFILHPRITARL